MKHVCPAEPKPGHASRPMLEHDSCSSTSLSCKWMRLSYRARRGPCAEPPSLTIDVVARMGGRRARDRVMRAPAPEQPPASCTPSSTSGFVVVLLRASDTPPSCQLRLCPLWDLRAAASRCCMHKGRAGCIRSSLVCNVPGHGPVDFVQPVS
ncbi:hypothetical protein Micbo1qcDRAFT_48786 [Microdochium bolleyi]|uniref:Uncharacterized protein n=1 Tax=Microdochium bolleyi TaxID=196109 RepID=A0A136IKM5_9PEZI|nr:hypothetical protein Micbo1qcDRAFT_48786 [Microdochium bolleyi]